MKKVYIDRASARMRDIIAAAEQHQEDSMALREIIAIIGRRAFSLIIVVFAFFNMLPVAIMPGVSSLTAIPCLFVGIQMLMARSQLWLPNFLANRRLPAHAVVSVLQKSTRFFEKVEYLLKPRWRWLFARVSLWFIGLFVTCISFLLMLPIPFSNHIFGGILILAGLALLEYDGFVLILSLLCAVTYFTLAWNFLRYLIHLVSQSM